MILSYTCRKCHAINHIKSSVLSRQELENEIGRYFMSDCIACGADEEYHVNEVTGGASRGVEYFIMGGICLIFTFLVLIMASIWLIIMLFPLWYSFKFLNEQEQRRVNTFNKHLISRNRK